jgi:acyl-CoA synthetase (AMP-forming)/AMP-acid ligase II
VLIDRMSPGTHPRPHRSGAVPDTDGLAFLDGGPDPVPDVGHLGASLTRAAALPGAGEIVLLRQDGRWTQSSYTDLLRDADLVLGGLRCAAHLPPASPVILAIEEEPDLLAAVWACLLGGLVPVPVRAGRNGEARDSTLLTLTAVGELFNRPVLVTGRADGDGVPPWPDPRALPPTVRWIGDVDGLRSSGASGFRHTPSPDDVALLLLTSGSTGVPKAVQLTHRNILARTAATVAARGLTVAQRSFNWMPLDHVGGLVMFHLRDVYLGCAQAHARMSWVLEDPLRWLAAMSELRSTVTWAPNFAFGLVVDRAVDLSGRSWDLTALGHIMNGGEPVKPRVAARFLDLLAPYGLPHTAMHPGWGMSETSSGVVDCVFDPAPADEQTRFVSVGRPAAGVQLRVVDDHGRLVPEGVVGHLHVAGAPITPGYHANSQQNRQSFTSDGWFVTGDLALIKEGALTVTGRADDILELGAVTYHGHEIEARVEELAFVEPSYTVACTAPAPETGREELTVFLHLRRDVGVTQARQRVAELLSASFGVARVRVVPVERQDVPKTGIGKLQRDQMRAWFLDQSRTPAGRLLQDPRPEPAESGRTEEA